MAIDKASPEETAAFMDRVLDMSVKPHVEKIARIAADGDVAIVFHEAATDLPHVRTFVDTLRRSETGPVVRLTRSRARTLFRDLETQDPTFWAWVTTKRDHVRVLVVAHEGSTLCVNCTDGGWGFEPGTLDSERKLN